MSFALEERLRQLGVTMDVKYISQKPVSLKDAQFQYLITIHKEGREVWQGNYHMGLAHYPRFDKCFTSSNRQVMSVAGEEELLQVLFHGGKHTKDGTNLYVKPKLGYVMASLLWDASPVTDGLLFEEWCGENGCNPDSIKDKSTYEQCLNIGLRLVRAFGAAELPQLLELTAE
jgi:hypothetical protein